MFKNSLIPDSKELRNIIYEHYGILPRYPTIMPINRETG